MPEENYPAPNDQGELIFAVQKEYDRLARLTNNKDSLLRFFEVIKIPRGERIEVIGKLDWQGFLKDPERNLQSLVCR